MLCAARCCPQSQKDPRFTEQQDSWQIKQSLNHPWLEILKTKGLRLFSTVSEVSPPPGSGTGLRDSVVLWRLRTCHALKGQLKRQACADIWADATFYKWKRTHLCG